MATAIATSKQGLYAALARSDDATAPALAVTAGIHPRYAREWLEQQAAAGLAYLAPIGGQVASLDGVMPRLVDAYRTGSGIGFGDYGPYLRDRQGAFNRPAFMNALASEWLAIGAPDVHHRLESDPPAMALDVGCGYGWSSVALAAAYPNVRVVGVDLDEPSIEAAIRHARESGVDDRVSFHVAEAASPDLQGRFNAVFVFEALHDMAQPVARRHQSRTHRHGHRHRHGRARR